MDVDANRKERDTTSPNQHEPSRKRSRRCQRAAINIHSCYRFLGRVRFGKLIRHKGENGQRKNCIGHQPGQADEEQRNALVDVCLRGETVWITSRVGIVRILVHLHIVDRHDRQGRQVFEIDDSEVEQNAQIDDHVLQIRRTPNQRRAGSDSGFT